MQIHHRTVCKGPIRLKMWMLGPHAGIHYRPNDPIAEAVEAALRGYRFDRGRGLIDLWVSFEIGPNRIDRSLRLVDRGNIRRNQALDLRAGQLPNGVLVGKQKRFPPPPTRCHKYCTRFIASSIPDSKRRFSSIMIGKGFDRDSA